MHLFSHCDIYFEIESPVCMLFKHTNVQCHCASTISRIALKRYSKEHRYSTLFAIIWKSHVTSVKEKEKNHVKCAYKQYSWDFHFKRWSCTQRVMCVECSNFKWNKPHISYIANIVCNFKCVVHITRMHACKMPHGNGNTNANKLIMKNRERSEGEKKRYRT